ALVDVGAEGGAGGAQPRVERIGVLPVGDRRIEVGAAAEPALRGREEARVHMYRGNMRVRHVRDEADSRRKEARVVARTVNRGGEIGCELARDRGNVDAD